MALRFFDGFDSAPDLVGGWTASGATLSTVTGRDGVGRGVSGSSGALLLKYVLPAAQATTIVGVAWKVASSGFANGANGYALTVYGDSGVTAHLAVNFDAAGRIQLRRGNGGGTVIATSSHTPVVDGSWHYVELKCTIADSGGTAIVHLDNVEIINFTGDTKNAGTNTTVDAISVPAGLLHAADDLYVCDGVDGTTLTPAQNLALNNFLGDVTVKPQRPNGNGASSQWIGSDGNSTDNYQLVDEVPFSSADFVGSSTAGDRDLYDVTDLTGVPTVLAVQVKAFAAKSDAGTRSIKTITRAPSGTVAASSAVALSTSYGTIAGPIQTKDPDGTTWTASSVNAAQYGVETA